MTSQKLRLWQVKSTEAETTCKLSSIGGGGGFITFLVKSGVDAHHSKVDNFEIHPPVRPFWKVANSVGHCLVQTAGATFFSLLAVVHQHPGYPSSSQPSARTSQFSSVLMVLRVFTVSIATLWPSTLESFAYCSV